VHDFEWLFLCWQKHNCCSLLLKLIIYSCHFRY
jgi:hypothetical protein